MAHYFIGVHLRRKENSWFLESIFFFFFYYVIATCSPFSSWSSRVGEVKAWLSENEVKRPLRYVQLTRRCAGELIPFPHTFCGFSCDGAALSSGLRSALSSRSVYSGLWPPSAACCSTPSAPTPRQSDSCLVGVFYPEPAPHSSNLVFLLTEKLHLTEFIGKDVWM